MVHDYYSILGISPNANAETIKQAYRKRALECHPDRGGSHSQMVLVNEAWLILSNPTTRKHYDSARINGDNNLAHSTVQQDAQNIRQKAQDYPRKWADFEQWFNSNYGTTMLGIGIILPTAGRSIARWLFVIAGFSLGFIFGLLICVFMDLKQSTLIRYILLGLSAGGAWLGVLLHFSMSKK